MSASEGQTSSFSPWVRQSRRVPRIRALKSYPYATKVAFEGLKTRPGDEVLERRKISIQWLAAVCSLSSGLACDDGASDENGPSEGDCDSVACETEGGEGHSDPADGGEPEGPFTEAQLNTIRLALGPMPDRPPLDLTNRYADDPAAAQLGQKFYFDTRYSEGNSTSCATCHDPQFGFQDARANTSPGLGGTATGRHAPTVINSGYGIGSDGLTNWQFWDGRKDSLWSQALGPPESTVEMGGARTGVAYMITDYYRDEYEAVFGELPPLHDGDGARLYDATARPGVESWDALSEEARHDINSVYVNFGKAIAAYERLIVSRGSRFDLFYRDIARGARDSEHLTELEKVGLAAFVGDARCIDCHRGPLLSDWKFHSIALAQTGDNVPSEDPGRAAGIAGVLGDEFNCAGEWSDHPNKSMCAVSSLAPTPSELGGFKTPGLRDVTKTAPYMHTGTLATLEEVMVHYDSGGDTQGFVGTPHNALLEPLDLSEIQLQGLVAFMGALDGEALDPSLMSSPKLPE